MIKRASSAIQHRDSWCGVSFSLTGKNLTGVELHKEKPFNELSGIFKDYSLGVSLHTSAGYLVRIKLPFSGRRKIGMVINNELAGVLPFDQDDTVTDFREIGKGNVLAVAVQKESLDPFKGIKGLNNVTVNCLASLYALKWFKALPQTDYVFLHIDRNVASIMVFSSGMLQGLRQFFYSPESDTLTDAISVLLNSRDLSGILFYMVSNDEDALVEKEKIEKRFNIRINMPSPEKYIKADEYPTWLWSAVGSALLSLNPRDDINLLKLKRLEISVPTKLLFVGSGCLAAVSVIVLLLSTVNLYSKNQVYKSLSAEQNRIYRSMFPQAPPMRDVNKFIEDRIKTMDRDVGGAGINAVMPPLQVLAEISNKIDKQLDVKINEFVSDEKEFAISGSTTSFASVEKMKSSIEQINEIRDVEIQSVDIAAGKQVRFRIKGRL